MSELYRLLVEEDSSYRNYLYVDYLRPDKDEKGEKPVPDLVFRDSNGKQGRSRNQSSC